MSGEVKNRLENSHNLQTRTDREGVAAEVLKDPFIRMGIFWDGFADHYADWQSGIDTQGSWGELAQYGVGGFAAGFRQLLQTDELFNSGAASSGPAKMFFEGFEKFAGGLGATGGSAFEIAAFFLSDGRYKNTADLDRLSCFLSKFVLPYSTPFVSLYQSIKDGRRFADVYRENSFELADYLVANVLGHNESNPFVYDNGTTVATNLILLGLMARGGFGKSSATKNIRPNFEVIEGGKGRPSAGEPVGAHSEGAKVIELRPVRNNASTVAKLFEERIPSDRLIVEAGQTARIAEFVPEIATDSVSIPSVKDLGIDIPEMSVMWLGDSDEEIAKQLGITVTELNAQRMLRDAYRMLKYLEAQEETLKLEEGTFTNIFLNKLNPQIRNIILHGRSQNSSSGNAIRASAGGSGGKVQTTPAEPSSPQSPEEHWPELWKKLNGGYASEKDALNAILELGIPPEHPVFDAILYKYFTIPRNIAGAETSSAQDYMSNAILYYRLYNGVLAHLKRREVPSWKSSFGPKQFVSLHNTRKKISELDLFDHVCKKFWYFDSYTQVFVIQLIEDCIRLDTSNPETAASWIWFLYSERFEEHFSSLAKSEMRRLFQRLYDNPIWRSYLPKEMADDIARKKAVTYEDTDAELGVRSFMNILEGELAERAQRGTSWEGRALPVSITDGHWDSPVSLEGIERFKEAVQRAGVPLPPVVEKLFRNIRYIGKAEELAAVEWMRASIAKITGRRQFYFVHVGAAYQGRVKSGAALSGALAEQLKDPNQKLFKGILNPESLSKLKAKDKNTLFIIPDDAAYSGAQIKDLVGHLKNLGVPEKNIVVVLMGSTQDAYERIKGLGVRVEAEYKIPTILDVFDHDELKAFSKFLFNLDKRSTWIASNWLPQGLCINSLGFWGNKIPDSFPAPLLRTRRTHDHVEPDLWLIDDTKLSYPDNTTRFSPTPKQ